jgi:YYY domain-containing protein
LLFFVCRPLRDRGFLLARTFGWLIAGWMLWWAVNLGVMQNSVTHSYFVLAFFAVIGAAAVWAQRRELGLFVRRHWPILLVSELLFAVAYLGFVWVRLQNPDLWQPWFGGEKQMEFAILNGVLRSATFPPMDPHFSGGIINYYYFGLYLVGYLIKLTGIYAEVAFNLALPTVFAMTVTSTFALAYSAVRGDRQLPRTWYVGLVGALLAPLFVTLMGNLDGIAQIFRLAGGMAPSDFQSAIPGLKPLVDGVRALPSLLLTGTELPPYDFWGPSRVIPDTINEFPWWSFLFADLHPHIIGIPLSAVFLSLIYVLICDAAIDWRKEWRYGVALLFSLALMLGAMAVVNLWELPTYLGVGILAFLVSQYWGRGTIRWGLSLAGSLAFGVGAYFLFYPFFRDYVNVGASGVGLVQEPDPLGLWLLIWGFLLFMVFSWLLYAATRPALPIPEIDERGYRTVIRSGGVERAVALFFRRFDRLPVALYRHGKMVQRPAIGYLFVLFLLPLTLLLAVIAWLAGRTALALVLPFVGLAFALLWRRGRSTDAGGVFATLAAVTALALLAGTQIFYLRDFLDNSPYYRMNTLFKFFNQAWVLLALASAIAMPRLWGSIVNGATGLVERVRWPLAGRVVWAVAFVLLLGSSLAYTFYGTPARLEQRFPGWQPEIGTLNGLDYMIQGSYAWPDESNRVELSYEWEAVQWLLANVRGHVVIAEAADVDYYRVGGTRIASYTGLSGLRGMHEQEQRYPEDVGYRDGVHREFWATPSWDRTQELIDELEIGLIYVGQLERYQHPEGAAKIRAMADAGLLIELFRNERAAIYAVPERLEQAADGRFYPVGG